MGFLLFNYIFLNSLLWLCAVPEIMLNIQWSFLYDVWRIASLKDIVSQRRIWSKFNQICSSLNLEISWMARQIYFSFHKWQGQCWRIAVNSNIVYFWYWYMCMCGKRLYTNFYLSRACFFFAFKSFVGLISLQYR